MIKVTLDKDGEILGVRAYLVEGDNRVIDQHNRSVETRSGRAAPNVLVTLVIDRAAGGHKVFADWFKVGGEQADLTKSDLTIEGYDNTGKVLQSKWLFHHVSVLRYIEYELDLHGAAGQFQLMDPISHHPLEGNSVVVILKASKLSTQANYNTGTDIAKFG